MKLNDSQRRADFSQKLFEKFKHENQRLPFDLFFSYLMDGMIDPSVIDEIRRYGVPTCNFSCNNAHQFYLVDEISSHFDYSLHSEKDARDDFLSVGANPLWWPMASNPNYFKPVDVPRSLDASFTGANYALRARYIAYLLENDVDVHTYGPGWVSGARTQLKSLGKRYWLLAQTLLANSLDVQAEKSNLLSNHDFRRYLANRFPNNVHPPVSDEYLIELYSRSHICLGFLEVYIEHNPIRPVTRHLHLREFEAPMSGALYLTGYSEELEEMFEPGKEVVTYRNQYELLDKAKYYLNNPEEAEKIRLGGRTRALRDHTYHIRFKQLFQKINIG